MGAALIGVAIGFLGGLLGKGGSAIATPVLHAIGVPAIVAVAAPLPATIPSTLAASWVYWKERYLDGRVVRWVIACGVPATIAGAIATRWISGGLLVRLTDVILIILGIRLLVHRHGPGTADPGPGDAVVGDPVHDAIDILPTLVTTAVAGPTIASETFVSGERATVAMSNATTSSASWPMLVLVAVAVGFAGGLLANSGGFLLAPLLIAVVKLPIRSALATSLAASAVLAIPGTIVHAALGHIDWTLVAVFGATSVPLSMLGARVALRIDAARLERFYGAMLIVLGGGFLFVH